MCKIAIIICVYIIWYVHLLIVEELVGHGPGMICVCSALVDMTRYDQAEHEESNCSTSHSHLVLSVLLSVGLLVGSSS